MSINVSKGAALVSDVLFLVDQVRKMAPRVRVILGEVKDRSKD